MAGQHLGFLAPVTIAAPFTARKRACPDAQIVVAEVVRGSYTMGM